MVERPAGEPPGAQPSPEPFVAGDPSQEAAAVRDEAPRWRLAHGVGLLCGAALGDAARRDQIVYLLLAPSGRRYEVTEPLYRLAELVAGSGTAEALAARLSARLGHSIGASDVQRLIESRLVAPGLAFAEPSSPSPPRDMAPESV